MSLAQSDDRLWEESVGGFDSLGLFSDIADEKEAAWFNRRMELEALYNLEFDWDGEGADPLSKGLIDSAIQYFKNLHSKKQMPPPSRIIATQDGEIIIEWQFDGMYIEATISQPYLAEWMIVHPDGQVKHFDISWMPPQSNSLWESYGNYVA